MFERVLRIFATMFFQFLKMLIVGNNFFSFKYKLLQSCNRFIKRYYIYMHLTYITIIQNIHYHPKSTALFSKINGENKERENLKLVKSGVPLQIRKMRIKVSA